MAITELFSNKGHPYIQQLLASLPNYNKRQEKLSVINGQVPSLDDLPKGCRFHPRCLYAFARCRQSEPRMQQVNNRLIRCHLYPQWRSLPALEQQQQFWQQERKEQQPLLQVEHLSVAFAQKKKILGRNVLDFKAVDDLSFSLYQGKTQALVGESGCGKTTTTRRCCIYFRSPKVTSYTAIKTSYTCVAVLCELIARKYKLFFKIPFPQ